MGFFDSIFGGNQEQEPQQRRAARSDDEIAVERYRYLLRTAPPETIEEVHTEAFAKLTEEQRTLLFDELSTGAPAGEAPRDTSAKALASSATRQELRNPGTMERSLGNNGGPSFGSMVGSSLLGTVAGYVIGSALVGAFMPDLGATDAQSSEGDTSADGGGYDDGGGFDGGGDFGGGFDF